MELHLLEKFVAVAEELHFGRAAKRLHMSQPPLSQAVRKLEQEVGAELMARDRRNVALTHAGQAFYDEARGVLAAVGRAVATARRVAGGEAGRAGLGFIGPAMSAFLARAVRAFKARYPDTDLDLRELGTMEQARLLAAGDLDLGIVRLHGRAPELHGLAVRPVFREPYAAALPEDHPLAARTALDLSDLKGVPLVFFPRRMGPSLYDALVAACHKAGFVPDIVQEAEKKWTTLALVGAGVGAAFVPWTTAKGHVEGVAFKALGPGLPSVEMCAAWRSDNTNPLLPGLIEHIEANSGNA